jgi:hypothetical protein
MERMRLKRNSVLYIRVRVAPIVGYYFMENNHITLTFFAPVRNEQFDFEVK